MIGRDAGKALFVGLYEIRGSKPLDSSEFWSVPGNAVLKKYGMQGSAMDGRSSILQFDLSPTDLYSSWKGKLVISWPGLERSWWRWAHRTETMSILAILEESAWEWPMPKWDEIDIPWDELRILPSHWNSKLSQWRGIYYI